MAGFFSRKVEAQSAMNGVEKALGQVEKLVALRPGEAAPKKAQDTLSALKANIKAITTAANTANTPIAESNSSSSNTSPSR